LTIALARPPNGALVAALVVCSTAVRTVAAWRVEGPWITPDETIYTLLGRSLWETGRLSILGGETGFYTLFYPLLVGLPLSLDDPETGRRVLQLLQALAMSMTAVPLYLWGRSLVRGRWSLVAPALTLALPSLGYSALVMSEALFLPVATLALWLLARALEQPTRLRQLLLFAAVALAAGTRLQALVLVPVVVSAVLAKAIFDRDGEVLRRFAPALALLTAGGAAVALVAGAGSLGAYSVVAESEYELGRALEFVGYHAVGVVLLTGLVPALALSIAALPVLRGREPSSARRAFVAVALAYVPWLALEVGVFASKHVGHLAGRDLLTASPLLLLGLAVWLDAGAPRPQPFASILAFALAASAIVLPVRSFASERTVHDVFELVPLVRLSAEARELWLAMAVAAAAALFVLVPPRLAYVLPAVLGIAFAAISATVVLEAERQSASGRDDFFEGRPSWIDDIGVNRVAYLYAGEPRWTGVWNHLYWNRSISAVWSLAGPVPGPLPQSHVLARGDGRLFVADGPVRARAVVAPTNIVLIGKRAATIRQQGMRAAGLVLWRTDGPVWISSVSANVLANGDLIGGAALRVYGCDSGRLELTLLGKADFPVAVRLDGITRKVIELRTGDVWRGVVPVTPDATEDGTCLYEIASEGLVGSTRLEFVRG
jgi:hypothetical protein